MIDRQPIPAGPFPMGDDAARLYPSDEDETPRRIVAVEAFRIGRVPVTVPNAAYAEFVAEGGAAPPPHQPARADHPVAFVDRHESSAFCAWAGGRLPTEAEWEKAARGTDGRTYPWGDEEDAGRTAIGSGMKHGTTAPVGSHPAGASPYGLLDMAGNVWEWTATAYPPGERVLRGGSFASPGLAAARCAFRSHSKPERRQAHIGFRGARGGT